MSFFTYLQQVCCNVSFKSICVDKQVVQLVSINGGGGRVFPIIGSCYIGHDFHYFSARRIHALLSLSIPFLRIVYESSVQIVEDC